GGGRPAALGGGERDGVGVALDVEVAEEREAGGGDFFPGIGGEAEGPFHVGLAGGEPDLADEHVAHDDGVFPAHDEFARRSGGGQRRQRHAPAPVGRGGGGGALPGEGDGDAFAGIGGAPDRQRLALLEHGPVA